MAKAHIINNICYGNANSNVSKVGRSVCVNMVPESQADSASSKMILRSISGTKLYKTMPESNCRGMFRVSRGYTGSSMLYAVYGSHLYLIAENHGATPIAYQIGAVSNGVSEPVSMTETNGYGDAHPHLVIADGVQVFAVDCTLNPGDQVNDYRAIALPVRADGETYIRPSHVAYLFGYLTVLDQGTDSFYRSYRYPFEELDANDQINYDIFMLGETDNRGNEMPCEWASDASLALTKAGSFLYVFGERSYQFFHFTSDEHYPFQCPDTAAGDIGILAPRSLATIGTTVFWLGSSDIGENGVWAIDKNQLSRISTVDIEHEISALTNRADAVAQAWQENGHVFYALTFRQDSRTFVYDVTEKLWHSRASYDSSRPNCEGAWRPQYSTLAYGKLFFGDLNSSALVVQDNNRWKEWDDLVIVRRRVSSIITDAFSPFYCDEVKLIVNVGQLSLNEVYGVGVKPPDPNLVPNVAIRYSWDGGMTWSDQEIASAGPLGRYDWQLEWYGLGMGEAMAIELSTSDPWPMSIVTAKIQGEPTSIL